MESVVSYSTAVPVQVGFIAQNKSDGAGTEKLKTAVADFLKPLLFLASSESIPWGAESHFYTLRSRA